MVSLRLVPLAISAALALAGMTIADHDHDEETTTTREYEPTKTGDSESTKTTTRTPATITITVGQVSHKFDPQEVKAKPGDTVRFVFAAGGHRVVQAAFKSPCVPYNWTSRVHGFDSGVIDPSQDPDAKPWDLRINDTEPVFFYCAAPESCIKHHMIGVINPNRTWSFAEQLNYAQKAEFQLAPGDPWPSEGAGSGALPTATSSSASPNEQDKDDDDSSGLSTGAIAGIAIGGSAVLLGAGALIYLCGRRGGFDKAYRKAFFLSPSTAHPGSDSFSPRSPNMIEANYANTVGAGGAGNALNSPKSPGQESSVLSTYGAPAGYEHLRNSMASSPPFSSIPSSPQGMPVVPGPGQGNGGLYAGYDTAYQGAYPQAGQRQYAAYAPAPAELPGTEVPAPTRSPPPGYK